jgi:spore coat protein U-like protein
MVSPIHCRKLHFFKKEKSMKMKLKQRNIKISIISAMLAGTVGLSSASFATNFQVKTTVVGACTLAATDMDFGNYDTTIGTPNDAISTITHTCTNGTAATIAISQGSTTDGASTAIAPVRQMANGAITLAYSISTSVGGAEWGNTKASGSVFTSNGSPTPVNVYGRIAAGLAVTAGNYTDSLTVTVEY